MEGEELAINLVILYWIPTYVEFKIFHTVFPSKIFPQNFSLQNLGVPLGGLWCSAIQGAWRDINRP
jgi:hypothetical protein